jgi:hypothetical protein
MTKSFHRNKWRERNIAPDHKRHSSPVHAIMGEQIVGYVELPRAYSPRSMNVSAVSPLCAPRRNGCDTRLSVRSSADDRCDSHENLSTRWGH